MPVVNSSGLVDARALDQVRPHLAAAAPDAVRAVEVYERCHTAERRLMAEGHEAHRQPHTARRRHHDLVVHDLLQGRTPDDTALWLDVEQADALLPLAQARHAAAADALQRAGYALQEALQRCWPTALPYVAQNRVRRPTGLDLLAQIMVWPVLSAPPAVETANTDLGHFAQWWPLSVEPLDTVHHRRDRCEWEEWCWGELAAGRYDTEGDTITLQQTWTPPRYSSMSYEGRQQSYQPVVFATPARVAAYEQQLAQRH